MELAPILLINGAWIAEYVNIQKDGTGIIYYLGRRIVLEYVEGNFPYWKEI